MDSGTLTQKELRKQYLLQYKKGDIEGAISTIESMQMELFDATFYIRLLLHTEQKTKAKLVYSTHVKPIMMQSEDFSTYSREEAVHMLTCLSNMSFYFNVFNKPNDYINPALDLLDRVDYNEDVLVVANTLYNIGELQYLLQKVDTSIEYLLRAEDYILSHFTGEDELYDILIRIYTKLAQNYDKTNITRALFYIRKAKDIYTLHRDVISQTHKLMYLWEDAKLTLEKYGFNKVSNIIQNIIDELQNTSSSYINNLILEYIYHTYIILGLQDLATVVFSQMQLDESNPWWGIFAIDTLFMKDDIEWDQLLYIIGNTVRNKNIPDMFNQRLLELFAKFDVDKYIVSYKLTEYADLKITQRTTLKDKKDEIEAFLDNLYKTPTLDDYYLLLQMLFQSTVSTAEIKKTIYSLLFRNELGKIELRKIGFLIQSKLLGDSTKLHNDITKDVNRIIGVLLLMYINDVIGEQVFEMPKNKYALEQYHIVKEMLLKPHNIRGFDDIIAYIYNILETIGFMYCFEITPTVPNAKQYIGGNKYLMQYEALSKKIVVDDISRFNIYIKEPRDTKQIELALLEQFYVYLLRETVTRAFFNVYGSFDGLTGVYNNASGRDIIERLLYRKLSVIERSLHSKFSDRGDNVCMTLIFVDIDHFKQLNDTYGHDTGDRLLIGLAQKFVAMLRKTDYVIRWGGDEFVLLLVNDKTNAIKSNRKVEKIVQRLKEAVANDQNTLLRNLEFSYGYILDKQIDQYLSDAITKYDQKHAVENTMRYIIEYADMRMYKQKRRRR